MKRQTISQHYHETNFDLADPLKRPQRDHAGVLRPHFGNHHNAIFCQFYLVNVSNQPAPSSLHYCHLPNPNFCLLLPGPLHQPNVVPLDPFLPHSNLFSTLQLEQFKIQILICHTTHSSSFKNPHVDFHSLQHKNQNLHHNPQGSASFPSLSLSSLPLFSALQPSGPLSVSQTHNTPSAIRLSLPGTLFPVSPSPLHNSHSCSELQPKACWPPDQVTSLCYMCSQHHRPFSHSL